MKLAFSHVSAARHSKRWTLKCTWRKRRARGSQSVSRREMFVEVSRHRGLEDIGSESMSALIYG
jgi:hypothetical protein